MNTTAGVVALVVVFVVIVYIAGHYNHLVMLKHNVHKAWSNIDVLLKQRNEELPGLAAVCRRYMAHERRLLEQLAAARELSMRAQQGGEVIQVGAAEARVHASVQSVLARAEAYPQLRADRALSDITTRIAELETAIADRREFYNESVKISNAAVQRFPGNVYAMVFGFRSVAYLELDSSSLVLRGS